MPAEGVDVEMTYPEFVKIKHQEFPTPIAPDPPIRGQRPFAGDPRLYQNPYAIGRNSEGEPTVVGHKVKYRFKSVKHSTKSSTRELYATFRSIKEVQGFEIKYIIKVDNLPKPLIGELNVAVKKMVI